MLPPPTESFAMVYNMCMYIYIYKASIYLASPNCNFPAPYSFILLQEIGAP